MRYDDGKRYDRRKRYEEYLDYLCGTVVLVRDPVCEFCGLAASWRPRHLYAKLRHQNIRWRITGVVAVCQKCYRGYRDDPLLYLDKYFYCKWVNGLTRVDAREASVRMSAKALASLEFTLRGQLNTFLSVDSRISWVEHALDGDVRGQALTKGYLRKLRRWSRENWRRG
jgi:hypothetical protein